MEFIFIQYFYFIGGRWGESGGRMEGGVEPYLVVLRELVWFQEWAQISYQQGKNLATYTILSGPDNNF